MATKTKTTPAQRIAEAIAQVQPCTCGEASRCSYCQFDTEEAARIIALGIDLPLSALRAIAQLESHGCMQAQDIAATALAAFESKPNDDRLPQGWSENKGNDPEQE